MEPSQDGYTLSRQGHEGGPVTGAPVPGVVNDHQGIIPGGSPLVPSVKALGNTTRKKKGALQYSGNILKIRRDWSLPFREIEVPPFNFYREYKILHGSMN